MPPASTVDVARGRGRARARAVDTVLAIVAAVAIYSLSHHETREPRWWGSMVVCCGTYSYCAGSAGNQPVNHLTCA